MFATLWTCIHKEGESVKRIGKTKVALKNAKITNPYTNIHPHLASYWKLKQKTFSYDMASFLVGIPPWHTIEHFQLFAFCLEQIRKVHKFGLAKSENEK